ncbi:MAG: hypothetical protein OEW09_01890, partial [Anaerolineae bacterium]|nr:hypothetical protein [Anaerolineae bacterium]
MREQDHKMWPFKPRTSFAISISILVLSLIVLAISRTTYSWPSQESERTVLLGIFVLSLIPLLLRLADVVIERGAVVEVKGVKIDFSQVQTAATPGITIPANIGVTGQAVTDSSTNEILDALRQATACEVVIINLEEGEAWWETRLLVLLAGAVRLNRPEKVVFVGMDGGINECFQGWGHPYKLLRRLLEAHPQYVRSYQAVLAAARQWELVEPQGPNSQPPQPA